MTITLPKAWPWPSPYHFSSYSVHATSSSFVYKLCSTFDGSHINGRAEHFALVFCILLPRSPLCGWTLDKACKASWKSVEIHGNTASIIQCHSLFLLPRVIPYQARRTYQDFDTNADFHLLPMSLTRFCRPEMISKDIP